MCPPSKAQSADEFLFGNCKRKDLKITTIFNYNQLIKYRAPKILKIFLLLCVISATILSVKVTAQTLDTKNATKAGIQNFIDTCKQINSFKAQFVQSYYNALTRETASEKGSFLFQSPNLLTMTYDQPSGNFFMSDGKYFYFYDAEENQVIKSDISEERTVWLKLITSCNIEAHFKIQQINETPKITRLLLEPIVLNDEISTVETEIDNTLHVLSKITINEPTGNWNSFTFSEIMLNIEIDPKIFIFSAPSDAEIIYMQ
ncbi:MAG: hypothetical protein A2Y62_16815 [Candidatus Fischerbacteria bacterium RBG_13_37_8]|uniref:Outer membrane lipoprotein carrier protein LolA n=1 Tax=Candidatus Fischerbacteria bacterium RBG_13_37_8 TaxID=1817863 RepID=A0A1F5V9J6_9BACT|nr:MAG: hypothetical protein A2Y62_16815 [Candidatus Fischerbacteria bacterium RBG_13_37_8]